MIPLVSVVPELAKLREVAEQTIAEVAAEQGVELNIEIGTMIELPRAAVTADEIATKADFFSFGTNDLTQTTFGFSRDDVEAEFIPQYLKERLLPYNPFATVDPGVAKLVKMGVELGHQATRTSPAACAASTAATRTPPHVPQHRPGLRVLQPVPRAAGASGRRPSTIEPSRQNSPQKPYGIWNAKGGPRGAPFLVWGCMVRC
mgnify:CR=1 FL=1